MNKFIIRQSLLLLLTATIWGVAFVSQSVGMDYVGPFTFNAVRSLIGAAVLVPCLFLLKKLQKKEKGQEVHKKEDKKTLLTGGICCGVILAVASSFQQFGLLYTTVGKAGFITAMYIILVPLFGIFLKKKVGLRIGISVVIAVAGLYLLCMTESLKPETGDILLLLCAATFSFHIMVIDHFSPLVDGVKMSCIQFLTCGILCSICMFLFETPKLSLILTAWKPVLYAGVMSCGVAYTLQIVGQKGMNPTVASLIMSLESVISVLAGFVLLHEVLSKRELFGCVLMFAAIILAQLPEKRAAERR
ncbi:MAG: DMT family transporter [Lachnospiraceae bacterium]|nr:DMT family transporter [Lachnospiraceae bacterium]